MVILNADYIYRKGQLYYLVSLPFPCSLHLFGHAVHYAVAPVWIR